jgi:hypothetical protein
MGDYDEKINNQTIFFYLQSHLHVELLILILEKTFNLY